MSKPASNDMVPVSNATPTASICPTCRVFEIQPGSTLCQRCTRKAAIRVVENSRYRRHVEAVHRELTERRLTEIDPDWRDHYKTLEAAERAYWRELQVKTIDCGNLEPRDEI